MMSHEFVKKRGRKNKVLDKSVRGKRKTTCCNKFHHSFSDQIDVGFFSSKYNWEFYYF